MPDSVSKTRAILITGANGLLGHAMAETFLQRDADCHVYCGTRQQQQRVQSLESAFPGRVTALPLEVTDPSAWAAAVEQIAAAGHELEVLVNNAGHHDDALLMSMTHGQWHDVISANLSSVFLGCQAVQRAMMLHKCGRIINIASLSALHPPAGQTNYAAAKAGVIGLTQSLAKEVARMGMTVNAVTPAHIDGATPSHWSAEELRAAKMRTPMRRFVQATEIAAAVFFLASPEASYITGTTLRMDGGLV
jgi:3-oxoacyl-[acyl-carrier protein] reductase